MRFAVPAPAAFAAFVAALGLSLLWPNATASAAGRDAFVGTWSVILSPDESAAAGAKEIKDTLTFKGMQFTSAEFKKLGFEPAQYEEDTRSGIAATFKAQAKHKTDGSTTAWSGTSTANTLNGEMTWTKADGSVVHYTLKGERKN